MNRKLNYMKIAQNAVDMARQNDGRVHYSAVAFACRISFSSAAHILRGYGEYAPEVEYDHQSGELTVVEDNRRPDQEVQETEDP